MTSRWNASTEESCPTRFGERIGRPGDPPDGAGTPKKVARVAWMRKRLTILECDDADTHDVAADWPIRDRLTLKTAAIV